MHVDNTMLRWISAAGTHPARLPTAMEQKGTCGYRKLGRGRNTGRSRPWAKEWGHD